jgi:hypothetical protein
MCVPTFAIEGLPDGRVSDVEAVNLKDLIMRNLVACGILSLIFINACGDGKPEKRSVPAAASLTDPVKQDPNQNCEGKDCPIYSYPQLGANADIPGSYTFLDTPDANLCVDAFIRKGIILPDTTVARTLDATSWKSEGIAISDLETSTIPILNIVHLRQECSNVMFQFYNRNGFYCIVKNTSNFSNVRIQRSCDAKMTEIEPIHHDSQGSSLNLFWWFPKTPAKDPNATTGTYNSRLTEMPCIP